MNNNIFNVDLTRTLPPVLKNDPKMQALAQVIAKELQENARQIKNNIIYAKIDELPEKLLDVLAYDLHIDWYDYDYPVQAKRDMIKTSVKVHKKLGTVYAMETALRTIYPESKVIEWFDYGGKPFCFLVQLDITEMKIEPDKYRIIKAINIYKRLTAHLEALIYLKRDSYRVQIRHENKLRFTSSFYQAQSAMLLCYDGSVKYDGSAKYNGRKPGKKEPYLMQLKLEKKVKISPGYEIRLKIKKHLTKYDGHTKYSGKRYHLEIDAVL